MSLKTDYLEGSTGLTQKLADAYTAGRKFIMPAVTGVLADSITTATTSPMFTIANAGSASPISNGYTVTYNDGSEDVTLTVIGAPVGSTFDTTVAPTGVVSGKSLSYSSPRPASYTTLKAELINAAAQGKAKFTASIETTYMPAVLRQNTLIQKAYFDGIMAAMADENLYSYEVKLTLNTSDTMVTKVDFVFTLTNGC